MAKCPAARFFSPDKASLTQEYCENWQSMAEKEPPFGRVDNFQTDPSAMDEYYMLKYYVTESFYEKIVAEDYTVVQAADRCLVESIDEQNQNLTKAERQRRRPT